LSSIQSTLEGYLSSRLGGKAEIKSMKPLTGGACQDNYLMDLEVQGGSQSGAYNLVMRTDKGASLFASYYPVRMSLQFAPSRIMQA
jgi:hypothetical protein